ncbi:hypothetical protein [Desulfatibacillum aliphaticivorans]|uniref:hypothetical protein n=1 Tax=Desulfatibacillum aliphaticivorans TaxID=218208 RepID=UPI00048900BC|nr:hypothetical protein [Desulfatibacillum aliphaticivorans]
MAASPAGAQSELCKGAPKARCVFLFIGIGWTSYSHTGVPVAASAMGGGDAKSSKAYTTTRTSPKKIASTINVEF